MTCVKGIFRSKTSIKRCAAVFRSVARILCGIDKLEIKEISTNSIRGISSIWGTFIHINSLLYSFNHNPLATIILLKARQKFRPN